MTGALRLERAIGVPGFWASALAVLGVIAKERGDPATSVRRAEEALALFQAIGNSSGVAEVRCTLAGLAADRGDDRAALVSYREALQLWASIGERWRIAWAFSGLAALAAAHGQPEPAATLVGVVDTRLEESGAGPWPTVRARYAWATATATAALGAARFAIMREAGQTLPFAAGVAVGMGVTVPDALAAMATPAPIPPAAVDRHGLTPREREVLQLVAAGHSNREIAATLSISVPTVKRHVSTILAKLDLPSRSAATAYAYIHTLT